MTNGSTTWNMTYNADGLRTSDVILGAAMGGLCTSVNPISSFGAKGLSEGFAAANALVLAEETMIITQPVLKSVAMLAFDTGATLVTGFGSFVAGLAYDYYAKQLE